MSSVTEPVAKANRAADTARGAEASRGAKEWLDALAGGACDQAQFFRGVGDLLQRAPDSGWELLGLVDQYFRRGKISAHLFGAIKTRLQGLLVGKGESDEVSNPAPQMQDEPPHGGAPPAVAISLARRATAAPGPSLKAAGPPAATTSAAPGDPAPPALHALAPGDLLRGRYLIQGLLGQGGMGVVYAAIDQYRLDRSSDDQKVALKLLHTEVIKRPRLFAELRREFQHLQSLSHPNIVRVHEFDRDGDLAFFTMEYLSGALLSQVLPARGSRPLHRSYALAIIRDTGSAVAHAHARGVVHGDLNPGNIFITDNGEVRILDFGASHQLHRGPWISEFANVDQIAVATAGYASCQVLEGEAADARDDVYALGCVAYILLTGTPAYGDKTPLHARSQRLTPARPRGLRGGQWKALREALHFDRERRPSNVAAWLERMDLRAAAAHLPPLVSLRTPPPRRGRGGDRIWMQVSAAIVCVACGWVAAINVDSLVGAGERIAAGLKSLLASFPDHSSGTENSAARPQAGMRRAGAEAQSGPAGSGAPVPADVRQTPADVRQTPADNRQTPADNRQTPADSRRALAAAEPFSTPGMRSAPPPTAAGTEPANRAADAIRARIELAADEVDVPPAEPTARVIVRRSRSLRGDVNFTWWTESGTAKSGTDFVPVTAHTERMESGQSTVNLIIPVVVDPGRRESRSFYVVIDDPGDNAMLGARTLTMVTLIGSEPPPVGASGP